MAKQESKEPKFETSHFILDNGNEIEVLISDEVADEVWEEIHQALKTGALWWCGNYSRSTVQVIYNGHTLTEVAMSHVIGIA